MQLLDHEGQVQLLAFQKAPTPQLQLQLPLATQRGKRAPEEGREVPGRLAWVGL